MPKLKVNKSAISGKFVSDEFARLHPDTTYAHTVKESAPDAPDGFNQQKAMDAISERITPEMRADDEQYQAEQRGMLKSRLGSPDAKIANARASTLVVLKNIENLQKLPDSELKQSRLENAFNQLAELIAEQGKYADAACLTKDETKREYYRLLIVAVVRPDSDSCGCPERIITDAKTGQQFREPAMHRMANVMSAKHGAVVGLFQCLTCGFQNVRA